MTSEPDWETQERDARVGYELCRHLDLDMTVTECIAWEPMRRALARVTQAARRRGLLSKTSGDIE